MASAVAGELLRLFLDFIKEFMMKILPIHFFATAVLAFGLSTIAHAQNALPINAAASVNGMIISNDMVEQGIQAALAQGQKDSPELRSAVLGRMIEVSLLSQQAEKDGLANSDRANQQLALIRQNYLADLELSTYMSNNPINDADVQAQYNREIASLGPQGLIVEYKVSDIAVATEAEAQAALARIKKGEAFDKVARSVSLAPNKVQGGAIGWVQAGQTLPQIASVLITLSKGQVSPAPIQMPQGWYLIKLEDKKSSKPPTFEQAKAAIRNGLAQKKQFEFLSQLRQGANIIVR
jgi:peptidyl-prolyl cis-trans isomerase C